MSLTIVAAVVVALFAGGYTAYGRWIAHHLRLDDATPTPAVTMHDGVDYVPTRRSFLLGQHFSAIAAAGPIVGPILAGLTFGWLPTLAWIVLGAIFIGAVHDFSSLIGSVRHRARSVAEIVQTYIGRRAYILFLSFIWVSLVYVITAFADLTANSFVEPTYGAGVATSSLLYLGLAMLMGVCLARFKMRLGMANVIFIPLVATSIWAGQRFPLQLPVIPGIRPVLVWDGVLLAYCFVASVMPVRILLQPRGYLGGTFLYVVLAAGLVGLVLGRVQVQYPAFVGLTGASGVPLVPMLFVTVACGACSGFHGLVCSGTTSKQIAKEGDCRPIGYGAMLLEGLVALIALATVMMLAPDDPVTKQSPDRIYAQGLARFVQQFGIHPHYAMAFVLLAFATFIFDTLDVATRLGRYILEELFGWRHALGRSAATVLTLALPAWCVTVTIPDAHGQLIPAWRVFWTVFGTSNQLLAALTLLGLTTWLRRTGRPWAFAAVPCVFMLVVTLWALGYLLRTWMSRWQAGGSLVDPVAVASLLLMALAVTLVVEGVRSCK